MYFPDHLKRVWPDPETGRTHDPLAALRRLTVATGGQTAGLLADRHGPDPVAAATAEGRLVAAARAAFEDPGPPDGRTDAGLLETLYAFLWYLEGKG